MEIRDEFTTVSAGRVSTYVTSDSVIMSSSEPDSRSDPRLGTLDERSRVRPSSLESDIR